MAVEQIGNALTFVVHYIETKVGKTGLTVTCTVYRVSDNSVLATAQPASAIGGGAYKYTLAAGSVTQEDLYLAIFSTATATVDQQDIPALWVVGKGGCEYLDGSIANVQTTVSALSGLWRQ